MDYSEDDSFEGPVPGAPRSGAVGLEAWRWEYEHQVRRVIDHLDACRDRGFLHSSLSAWDAERRHPTFIHYLDIGRSTIGRFVERKIARYTLDEDHEEAEFDSKYLRLHHAACATDDATLAHVFRLLRLHEMVELAGTALMAERQAEIVCAVVGEITAVRNDFASTATNAASDDPSNRQFQRGVEGWLGTVQSLILGLIADTGRDRATFLKEMFVRPSVNALRPSLDLQAAMSNALRDITNVYTNIVSQRGDEQLERRLLTGSLHSMWDRMRLLWDIVEQRKARAKADDDIIEEAYGEGEEEEIRGAIFRALPQMNRYRQLMFTRLLQALCVPQWAPFSIPPFSSEKATTSGGLARCVVGAFLDSTQAVAWPYEFPQQLSAFRASAALPQDMKSRLLRAIHVPVCAHLISEEEDLQRAGREQVLALAGFGTAAPYILSQFKDKDSEKHASAVEDFLESSCRVPEIV